jgi:hypothetical protein
VRPVNRLLTIRGTIQWLFPVSSEGGVEVVSRFSHSVYVSTCRSCGSLTGQVFCNLTSFAGTGHGFGMKLALDLFNIINRSIDPTY